MKNLDRIASVNKRSWERAVRNGAGSTKPILDLDVEVLRQYARGELKAISNDLARVWPDLGTVSPQVRERLETDATYAVYLDRQKADIAAYRRDEGIVLEETLDFRGLPGLSNEIKAKLEVVRPRTLGQDRIGQQVLVRWSVLDVKTAIRGEHMLGLGKFFFRNKYAFNHALQLHVRWCGNRG